MNKYYNNTVAVAAPVVLWKSPQPTIGDAFAAPNALWKFERRGG
jgi:hypothetical protein